MKTHQRSRIDESFPAVLVFALAGMLCHSAAAQSYSFQLLPASELTGETDLSASIVGSLIGNYDAQTNPGGTQTRPGLFGGSGNQPIPYIGTLTSNGPVEAQPDGVFTLDVNIPGESGLINGLAIDVLGGAEPSLPVTLAITYSTFHTVNPSFIYFGASNFPVPLGSASLASLTLTQLGGPAAVSIVPVEVDGQPVENQYAVAGTVDVEIAFEGLINGEVFSGDPVPLALALGGTLTIHPGKGTADFNVDADFVIDESSTGPFEPFPSVPVDLPTLNPDDPAHVLVSGQLQSLNFFMYLNGTLAAAGNAEVPPCPPIIGDLDCSGTVGVPDLLLLLAAWGDCDDCEDCPADLNGDCAVGVPDLLELLANWA